MEPCIHRTYCGGCIYQEIPYQDQLQLKAKDVLRHFQENSVAVDNFLGIEGSPSIYAYRNKMEYTFGDEVKGGELNLGLHQQGRFYSIMTTDKCQLVHEDFNVILRAVLAFARRKDYSFYHKRSHEGFLRHLVIRRGESTGQLLVNLVTTSKGSIDKEEFVNCIKGLELEGGIAGILHTENNQKSDAVICDKLNILWGQDYYNEEVLGLRFQVSAFSFFQTNVRAAERLYLEAISLVPDLEGKVVYDLYSGTGTIGQALAGYAKKVIGIELVEDAVKAAIANAEINKLSNCTFLAGDVLKVLDEIPEKPDLIFVDPPRAGINPKALDKILNYGIKEIVYISCNPKTLAQNLRVANEKGYKVNSLKAFDNFPFTRHTEVIAHIIK